MKQLKRTLSLAMSIVMLLSMCVTANAAYTPAHTEDADILYELGLFKGMGTDANGNPIYGLEQKATRIQGIVMLLHLLGEEAEAKAFEGTHPFTDVPEWGNKHVAYAYAKGYTAGTSATTFGSNDALLGKAYATFVLKALGYDANSDFNYNTALEKAAELGLIQAGECDGELYRDHCVMLSRNALRTNIKDSDQKLVEKLLDDGVVSEDAVKESCVLNGVVYVPFNLDDRGHKVLLSKAICAVIPNAFCIASGGDSSNSAKGIKWNALEQQKGMLVSNRFVRDYLAGRTSSIKTEKLEGTHHNTYIYGVVTVLDKNYNLIAYAVTTPENLAGDAIPFTTCFVEGKPEIERINSLLNNVQFYDADSLFYTDTTTTIHPDGSETSVSYVRIDESKIPDALSSAAVFFGDGLSPSLDRSNTIELRRSLLRLQAMAAKSSSDISNTERLTKISEAYQCTEDQISYHFSDENRSMAFYDENKDLIAIVTQSQPITANEIKTVIDLRES